MSKAHRRRRARLLWLDLECTGLDHHEDDIIEIGCSITDGELTVMAEFTSLVEPRRSAWNRLFEIPEVVAMHTANGLLGAISEGMYHDTLPTPSQVSAQVIERLEWSGAKTGNTWLAGSGVSHYDQRFLLTQMPDVAAFCRFGTVDIGVVRRMHDMFIGTDVSTENDNKTHRALDDVHCHLAETRAFVDMWKATQITDPTEVPASHSDDLA